MGEPVNAADVARIETACDRIARQAPIHGNLRQSALRVLRYIADWRKLQLKTTTTANAPTGTSPDVAAADTMEGTKG
ncbi:MAG: hypothetical protein C0483_14185 [Pirellula sp.]|nr:hypothetical protein [Pirellula sp.]